MKNEMIPGGPLAGFLWPGSFGGAPAASLRVCPSAGIFSRAGVATVGHTKRIALIGPLVQVPSTLPRLEQPQAFPRGYGMPLSIISALLQNRESQQTYSTLHHTALYASYIGV